MELLPYLEPKELIGLATYMKVDKELIKKAVLSSAAGSNDKNQNWEDLIVSTVEIFSSKNRVEKRRIVKMVKEIKKENLKILENQQTAAPKN